MGGGGEPPSYQCSTTVSGTGRRPLEPHRREEGARWDTKLT